MYIEKRKTDLNARVLDLTAYVWVQDNQAKVRISLKNCCYGTIKAIKFIVKGCNAFSESVMVDGKDSFIILLQDLTVGPLERVDELIAVLPDDRIRKVECTLCQICYADGSVVDAEEPHIIEYDIERLQMIGNELDEEISEREQLCYMREVNENTICYPQNTENGWICVCGQLNKEQNTKCMSCGNAKKVLFEYYNQSYVLNQCQQVRNRKIEESEKEKEKVLIEQKKLKYWIVGCVACVVLIVLLSVIGGISYVHTYGMDGAEQEQWENALQEYENWKEDVYELYYGTNYGEGNDGFHDLIVEHYGGEDNYYSAHRDELNVKKYSYSELLSIDVFNERREALLGRVGQINELTNLFPQKYQDIFERLCEYQKIRYIIAADVDSSKITENYLWGTYKKTMKLDEDISRIEEYLQDKYLDLEKVDLSTDVDMSYKPKTFSYSYSSEEDY